MRPAAASLHQAEVNEAVEAYESAQAKLGRADPAEFLPDPCDLLYLPTLLELVRVDLEYGWRRGSPTPLAEYQGRFPVLFDDPEIKQTLAFEEYRLRFQLGDNPSRREYQRRWGVRVEGWPAGSDERSRTSLLPAADSEAVAAVPAELAATFPEFLFLAELGEGAFGRVYLAKQKGLAGRQVVLKVAASVAVETHLLAQLQHTNVVPVYSVHHTATLHAVCMPYLGPTTLADVLLDLRGRGALPRSGKGLADTAQACKSTTRQELARQEKPQGLPKADLPAPAPVGWKQLERRSYVEAVLWLGACLADGLAHAHERGILHRDLKPANVLLTDDGTPMLLDFNLGEDVKGGGAAFIGGTLPYAAPEQLRAFQLKAGAVDARADVYSLGVILHELLTGLHPFPHRTGPLEGVLVEMLADRLDLPRPRSSNVEISPAVESIVRRCLEPDPARRYQSARQLHEDLQRQTEYRPLRHAPDRSPRERLGKWVRRHPRQALAVGAAAALLLVATLTAGLFVRGARHAQLEAAESARQFHLDSRKARLQLMTTRPTEPERLDQAIGEVERVLDQYGARTDPAWHQRRAVARLPDGDRRRLREEAGELLLLLATINARMAKSLDEPARTAGLRTAVEQNRAAEWCYPSDETPLVLRRQRAALGRMLDPSAPPPADEDPKTPRDLASLAHELMAQGRPAEALPLWRRATREAPDDLWGWVGLALCYESLERHAQAAACYDACVALDPRMPWLYLCRGTARLNAGDHADARTDLDHFLADRPEVARGYVNRALALEALGKHAEALADVDAAIERGLPQTRVYFIRSRLRARSGDVKGAKADRETGLRLAPSDELSFVVRGSARLPADPKGALADFDAALRLNPRSLHAMQNKASALSEYLRRPAEAVEVLDRLVGLYPDFVPARAGRGVLLARLGKRVAALRDAEESLKRDRQAATAYQVAGIYALTSKQQPGDSADALFLLTYSLRNGYGKELLPIDSDLDPIRKLPGFRRLAGKTEGP
jgi:serine/threonine protein kinase